MNRTSLGIVAVLLLLLGVITWARGPEGGSAMGFSAGCLRVGLVLAALWLALPQIKSLFRSAPARVFAWFLGGKSSNDPSKPAAPIKRPRRRSNS